MEKNGNSFAEKDDIDSCFETRCNDRYMNEIKMLNKMAYELLARKGSTTPLTGPENTLRLLKRTIRNQVKEYVGRKLSQIHNNTHRNGRTSKQATIATNIPVCQRKTKVNVSEIIAKFTTT
ncbi:unnamed protein product [Acanthoscelides obtectus]|uniref:Uncharacterized protein n=1 Tax=Acanthoscelides obtectus TaxID=200917 RepID=A0A9P0KZ06_ACAOB|nr:unnamed protein product [Acanthoscelides obtectus]CAK1647516.1 hypothetical protein AOBTE_LOCUS15244 [Acanthoscelides obtectus]